MADGCTAEDDTGGCLSPSDAEAYLASLEAMYLGVLDEQQLLLRDHGGLGRAAVPTQVSAQDAILGRAYTDIVLCVVRISRENPHLTAFDVERWLRSNGMHVYLVARPHERHLLSEGMAYVFGTNRTCTCGIDVVVTEDSARRAEMLTESGLAAEENNREKLKSAGFLCARPLAEEDVKYVYGSDEEVDHIAPSKRHQGEKRGRGAAGKRGS